MVSQNNYKKPFYKKLLLARRNVLNNHKVLKFKRKKWGRFTFFAKRNFKFFRRSRFYDQTKLAVNKFASLGNSFKKHYRNLLTKIRVLKILYGGFKKKQLKNILLINKKNRFSSVKPELKNKDSETLLLLENRLTTVLGRAKFCLTPKQGKQLVAHGHISVNGQIVKSQNCIIKTGDIIEVAKNTKSRSLIQQNLLKSPFWPLPPSFLSINYRTLTIINSTNPAKQRQIFFPFKLNINSIKNKAKFM